ncbi:MAG: hypothetical protein RL336_469, partial [Pseudomonadota bacterium]
MNIDLLTLQNSLARLVSSVHSAPNAPSDTLTDTIEAKVIALATIREATTHKFLLTLLLPDQNKTLRITSDIAAPRDSALVLQRLDGQWQLVPPNKDQQLQALIQLQQARISTQLPPLAETWQALQQWQQVLQSQTDLPPATKHQLGLLKQLLTTPTFNPKLEPPK